MRGSRAQVISRGESSCGTSAKKTIPHCSNSGNTRNTAQTRSGSNSGSNSTTKAGGEASKGYSGRSVLRSFLIGARSFLQVLISWMHTQCGSAAGPTQATAAGFVDLNAATVLHRTRQFPPLAANSLYPEATQAAEPNEKVLSIQKHAIEVGTVSSLAPAETAFPNPAAAAETAASLKAAATHGKGAGVNLPATAATDHLDTDTTRGFLATAAVVCETTSAAATQLHLSTGPEEHRETAATVPALIDRALLGESVIPLTAATPTKEIKEQATHLISTEEQVVFSPPTPSPLLAFTPATRLEATAAARSARDHPAKSAAEFLCAAEVIIKSRRERRARVPQHLTTSAATATLLSAAAAGIYCAFNTPVAILTPISSFAAAAAFPSTTNFLRFLPSNRSPFLQFLSSCPSCSLSRIPDTSAASATDDVAPPSHVAVPSSSSSSPAVGFAVLLADKNNIRLQTATSSSFSFSPSVEPVSFGSNSNGIRSPSVAVDSSLSFPAAEFDGPVAITKKKNATYSPVVAPSSSSIASAAESGAPVAPLSSVLGHSFSSLSSPNALAHPASLECSDISLGHTQLMCTNPQQQKRRSSSQQQLGGRMSSAFTLSSSSLFFSPSFVSAAISSSLFKQLHSPLLSGARGVDHIAKKRNTRPLTAATRQTEESRPFQLSTPQLQQRLSEKYMTTAWLGKPKSSVRSTRHHESQNIFFTSLLATTAPAEPHSSRGEGNKHECGSSSSSSENIRDSASVRNTSTNTENVEEGVGSRSTSGIETIEEGVRSRNSSSSSNSSSIKGSLRKAARSGTNSKTNIKEDVRRRSSTDTQQQSGRGRDTNEKERSKEGVRSSNDQSGQENTRESEAVGYRTRSDLEEDVISRGYSEENTEEAARGIYNSRSSNSSSSRLSIKNIKEGVRTDSNITEGNRSGIREGKGDGALSEEARLRRKIFPSNDGEEEEKEVGEAKQTAAIPNVSERQLPYSGVLFRKEQEPGHTLQPTQQEQVRKENEKNLEGTVAAGMAWRCTGSSNKDLVNRLRDAGVIKSSRVYEAMKAVDRGNFVDSCAYMDSPQPLGIGSATISAPHMHATALEELIDHLKPGNRVLDVGSGSGYLTVVMAHAVGVKGIGDDKGAAPDQPEGTAIGIDYVPGLVKYSQEHVKKAYPLLVSNPHFRLLEQDGWQGYPEAAPYDAIHVGAAANAIPQRLLQQLKIGGKMVLPVEESAEGDIMIEDEEEGQKPLSSCGKSGSTRSTGGEQGRGERRRERRIIAEEGEDEEENEEAGEGTQSSVARALWRRLMMGGGGQRFVAVTKDAEGKPHVKKLMGVMYVPLVKRKESSFSSE